jgi:hypothetical protein
MIARPILFSAPMIRALLDVSKTQTRRIVKPAPDWVAPMPCSSITDEGWQGPLDYSLWAHEGDQADGGARRCPYGAPSDLLWVRETCRAKELTTAEAYASEQEYPPGLDGVIYVADNVFQPIENSVEASDRWGRLNIYRGKRGVTVPPIHMPRWASRITLKITDVRVERLQEISEADAKAEGVEPLDSPAPEHREACDFDHALCGRCGGLRLYMAVRNGAAAFDTDCNECDTHVKRYRWLWESINGPGTWDDNPWVWVITFAAEKRNVDDVLKAAA